MKFDLVLSSDREMIGNGASWTAPGGVTSAHVVPTDMAPAFMTAGSVVVSSRNIKLAISSEVLDEPMLLPIEVLTSGAGATAPPKVLEEGLTHNDTVSLLAAGVPENP
jgi:hypothetical protein